MIVLLSDGRTDLPKGPRTVAESQKELDSTVKEAVSLNLPVYTIGLNYDGSLDSGTMSTIASMTGGKFYETTSSSQLNEIVADILMIIQKEEARSYRPHMIQKQEDTQRISR